MLVFVHVYNIPHAAYVFPQLRLEMQARSNGQRANTNRSQAVVLDTYFEKSVMPNGMLNHGSSFSSAISTRSGANNTDLQ
jgi:hypothetical protein